MEACKNGQIEIVKALVDCGADINACEFVGSDKVCRPCEPGQRYYLYYSPFIIACLHKQIKIVKYLLSLKVMYHESVVHDYDHDESVDYDCDEDDTLCDMAITYITNESDDRRAYDALHAACRAKNNEKIIDMLMKKKKRWKFELLTEEFDCDKNMIDYVKLKRERIMEKDKKNRKAAKIDVKVDS